MKHGFLLVDKPVGPTSHDAVSAVRRALHEQKAGHLGTLDPHASGLLVVAVGAKALKVIECFRDLSKEYEADIRFGAVSTTYDAEGQIDVVPAKPGWSIPDEGMLRRLLDDRFTGKIEQIPPAHSAVHVDGQRAYHLARRGEQVAMPSRTVEISRCDILSYTYPSLKLRIACGTGTYIRSLAHDIGQLVRSGAYLEHLRRTKVGLWKVEDAVAPDAAVWGSVLPLKEVLTGFSGIDLTAEEAEHIRHGRRIPREIAGDTFGWFEGLPVAMLAPARDGSRTAQPRKVL